MSIYHEQAAQNSDQRFSIGVDFDNTLVSYDQLFHQVATERGLITKETAVGKNQTRDSIRKLPDGEVKWQGVQAQVYGPRIGEAIPSPGVIEFLQECVRDSVKVYIISHKSEFATLDETGTNLRSAAMMWLEENRFLDTAAYGLIASSIYFESTREEKLERIQQLGCTHFIDDLEELFLEKCFPPKVRRLLYSPHHSPPKSAHFDVVGDWTKFREHLFHGLE